MSGSKPTVAIRLGIEGADKVRRELESLGKDGEKALKVFESSLAKANPGMQKLAGVTDAAATSVAGLTSRLGVAGSALTGVAAAGAGVGVAIGMGIGAAIRGAEELERLSLRTAAVIKATGGSAGLSAQQIRDLANSIEENTLASGASVERAAGQLLTFRSVAGDAFGRTLRAAQDLAAVGFGTVESATVQLGKALENPAEGLSALTRVGVSFTAAQKDLIETLVQTGRAAEAQGVILSAVEQQVGGAGAAEAGGLAGAYHRLSENVQGFLETVGQTGPIQVATSALNALGVAMGGLANLITPATATQAAEAAVTAAQRALANVRAQNEAQRAASAYGDAPAGAQQAERIAYDNLTEALAALQTLRNEAARTQATQDERAAAARLQSERETAAAGLKIVRETLDGKIKVQEAARLRLQRIEAAERVGEVTADEASRLRAESASRETEELAKLEQGHRRVAAATRAVGAAAKDADEHVQAFYKAQDKAAKEAAKEVEKAAEAQQKYHERSWDAFASIGERAADRVGDALVQAFVQGEGAAVNMGGILRGVAASVVADFAKLAIINPVLNSAFTSSSGPRPTLGAAFGGTSTGGGFGDLLGLGQLAGGKSILESIGLTGSGGILSTPLWGGVSAGEQAFLGAAGVANPASVGATTLGGLLGGAGAGFGAGMLVNNLLGGNSTGGTVGSGVGGLAGAAIGSLFGGPLIGGLLGGALGGGLGGMFGPGESVKGYGYQLTPSSNGMLQMSSPFYNESGKAAFDEATAGIAQINQYLGARGITVGGGVAVGGNKDGADYSNATAGTFSEGLSQLYYGSNNAQLDYAMANSRGRKFGSTADLQTFVEGFYSAQDAIAALSKETVPPFIASLNAINDNFSAAAAKASEYGLAVGEVTAAQAKAVEELFAARAETLRQAETNLDIRRLTAAGDQQGAELARQAESARLEVASFGDALEAMGLTAAEKAARLVALEEVQAAERAAIITRFGTQASVALTAALNPGTGLLRDLTYGSSSALSPSARYFAAMTDLNTAKSALDAGGSLSDYTQVASAVLPVARDFLGTSTRYAGLAAEVGQVLQANGGDGSLSAILSAQANTSDAQLNLTADIGSRTISELVSIRQAFERLATSVDAIIQRKAA